VFNKRRQSHSELSPTSLIVATESVELQQQQQQQHDDSIVVSDLAVRTRQLQLERESQRGRKRRSLLRCHDDANAADHSASSGSSATGRPTLTSTPIKRAHLLQQRKHFHDVDEVELEVEFVPDVPPEAVSDVVAVQLFSDGGENFADSNRSSAATATDGVMLKSRPKEGAAQSTATAVDVALPRKRLPPRTFSARRKNPSTMKPQSPNRSADCGDLTANDESSCRAFGLADTDCRRVVASMSKDITICGCDRTIVAIGTVSDHLEAASFFFFLKQPFDSP
jgi:hypothetical protein